MEKKRERNKEGKKESEGERERERKKKRKREKNVNNETSKLTFLQYLSYENLLFSTRKCSIQFM